MYPAILTAVVELVVTTFFMEIQKRNIDKNFDRLERERNKILDNYKG